MSAATTKMDQARRLVRKRGSVRPRDLAAHAIPADYLDRLHRLGEINRVARGVYSWPDAEVTEHHSLADIARLVPAGVVCLLSALQVHGLTTQTPHEVWLALPGKVAIAWLLARPGISAPIASATSVEQLQDLLDATTLELDAEAVKRLDEASA